MPTAKVRTKLKTNRGAKKRFKVSGSGKIKRAAANHNHILTKKSKKRKCRLRRTQIVHKSDVLGVERMLNIR